MNWHSGSERIGDSTMFGMRVRKSVTQPSCAVMVVMNGARSRHPYVAVMPWPSSGGALYESLKVSGLTLDVRSSSLLTKVTDYPAC